MISSDLETAINVNPTDFNLSNSEDAPLSVLSVNQVLWLLFGSVFVFSMQVSSSIRAHFVVRKFEHSLCLDWLYDA